MNLLYLKMKGFRKYKELIEIKFNNETYIIGGNGKGKSTIGYAIVWGFLGTDLRGNNKISMVNRESEDCFVEIGFKDNNEEEHILIRYKNEKFSKKNFISLDRKFVKQEDLKEYYQDIPLFLSIFNPEYFKELEPSKQKELINKYLPDISIKDVINKLEKDEREKITICDDKKSKINKEDKKEQFIIMNDDISKFIKENNERIRDTENKIKIEKGKLEYAKSITSEKLQKTKKFEKQEEIDLLEHEKNFLEQESKQKAKENLQNLIGEKEAKKLNVQIKLDKINEKGKKARIEYNKLISDPLSRCPCCNSLLDAEKKQIAIDLKRKEMFEYGDEKKEYEDQISTLQLDIAQLKMKLYGLGRIDYSERITEINENLRQLENEKKEVYDYNKTLELKIENVEKTRQNVIQIISGLEKLDEKITEYNIQNNIAKKLYCLVIQEKMKIAKTYMTDTDIVFYELIKSTGEIKDCFKITRNGEEMHSLSKSQKFVTILEISNMLNKVSGLNIPILIDDCESYPDYNFKYEDFQNQLIIIKAKRNRQLKISHSEEIITNPKTFRQNKITEYKKVA